MNILKTKINLHLNWDIDPEVEIEVDRMQSLEDHNFRYEERRSCYRAEDENGFGSFYFWQSPNNNGGFGGRSFPITMQDGREILLKGPFSSNSACINQVFPDRKPLIEVCFTEKTNYQDFHGNPHINRYGGIITIDLCCKLLNIMELDYEQFKIYVLDKKLKACNKSKEYQYRTQRICQRINELCHI